ncbi:hypothetical protein ABH931_001594 [Streptacidiphilus sp. MAP12-33]|uniref:hypothetical protein n=1 Tax=Streptacidiphilus sp. MAP12-33 TaxID=3156266 RepID=UPI003511E905
MTEPTERPAALTVDFSPCEPAGTVRGCALVRVRVHGPQDGSGAVLRLRRFLPRLTLLRCRDLAADGSPLGPERDALEPADAAVRTVELPLDAPPGADVREYRLEWELVPADHPTIGVEGAELLLFRATLLGRDADGDEETREQRNITVEWLDLDSLVRHHSGSPRTPAPLREALRTLLRAEVKNLPKCDRCRMRPELDRLLAADLVWEHSAGPGQGEIRRLVMARELAGIPQQDVFLRWHQHHAHEDLAEELDAARARHRARLAAYAAPK